MVIKINGTQLPVAPETYTPTIMDLDSEDSNRASDGTMTRDVIATKRKLEMAWGILKWPEISAILQLMKDPTFSVYFPDPMEGTYLTKYFYVGNRPAPAILSNNGEIYWKGLSISLVEV